ncbi:MAG: threonine aldolase family protein [Alphaproteobacteria bacterium]|nr:threonine aldolase family protein [Alphaproteobacteria bacterium]
MPKPILIDLVSDTASRPTQDMRRAMAEAPVGDEQRGEDPTVNALNERVADLLGQEAAMFLPSGTMCNQVAIATHCRAGDEIIAAEGAHVDGAEGAGAAVFAGSFVRRIACGRGIFTPDDIRSALRMRHAKIPRSRLVALEQSNNRGGGSVWRRDEIVAVVDVARQEGLALHMDGARLMNAVVASGEAASSYTALLDSVWLDLSKGLGCPIGGVLAGSRAFIEEADVWKHRFGGAMRQAGIVAAAGCHALDHHVDRLAEDHDNARRFAARIEQVPGIVLITSPVETNLVFFDVGGTGLHAEEIGARMLRQGIRLHVQSDRRIRAVTHLDIEAADIDRAADALEQILTG